MGRSSREPKSRRDDDRKKDSRSERNRKDDRNTSKESSKHDDNEDDSYPSKTSKQEKREKRDKEHKNRDLSDDDDNDDRRHRHHRESKRRHRERDDDGDDYDRQRKHRSSSSRHRRHSNDDSDNSNTKKRKRDQDSKRSDKKKSSKHKKSKKHSKHDKEESINDRKKSNSQSDSTKKIIVDKKNLYPLGDVLGHKPDRVLDPEQDYFEFHQHFWLYLYREQQVAFNDLTTEQSRKYFKEFTKQYNDGKLESAYYDTKGPPHEALNEIKTTGHKWGFQISDRESKNLQTLQQGIQKLTEYSSAQAISETKKPIHKDSATKLQTKEDEMQQKLDSKRTASYQGQKKHLQTIDELTGGRPDGRERLIEKRKEIGAKMHGAARDREEAASAPILSDDVIYGGSEMNFESALAVQKRRKMQQEEQKQQRINELQAKEDEKKKAMLQLLGLSDKIKPGEKIKIQPRQDL